MQDTVLQLTVHRINSHQTIDTKIVELKLTTVHSLSSCQAFVFKLFVRKDLKFGNSVVDVEPLQVQNPHLEPISLKRYSFGDLELILGQDIVHYFRPLDYFGKPTKKSTLVAVQLPSGWVLSSPLSLTSGLFSTYSKTVTRGETNSKLADSLPSWNDIESYGAYKHVDQRPGTVARAQKMLQGTTYHYGSGYNVGMLWPDDEISLPKKVFSALIQLKSLKCRPEEDPDLNKQYFTNIRDDLPKGYIIEVEKFTYTKTH